MSNDKKLKSHTGETKVTKNGLQMTIIEWISWNCIRVQFEDNTIVESSYSNFIKNTIIHPKEYPLLKARRIEEVVRLRNGIIATIINYRNDEDLDIQLSNNIILYAKSYRLFKNLQNINPNQILEISIQNRIGMTNIMNNGHEAKIIDYQNAHDITVQFDDGTIVYNKQYHHFCSGQISFPSKKTSSKLLYETNALYTSAGVEAQVINYYGPKEIEVKYEDGFYKKCGVDYYHNCRIPPHPTLKVYNCKKGVIKNASFGTFDVLELAYRLSNPWEVFYLCQCKKCRHKDILNPKQMLEHVCE